MRGLGSCAEAGSRDGRRLEREGVTKRTGHLQSNAVPGMPWTRIVLARGCRRNVDAGLDQSWAPAQAVSEVDPVPCVCQMALVLGDSLSAASPIGCANLSGRRRAEVEEAVI